MKYLLLIAWLIVLALCGTANARLTVGVLNASSGGGAAIPPSCTNSLDFSNACNSQYLVLGFP
jgi:hypothetical protein